MHGTRTRSILMYAGCALLIASFVTQHSEAQTTIYRVKESWDPTGKLVFGGTVGGTKYFGEFTDQNFGFIGGAHLKYFIVPEFSVQLAGGAGTYVYNRRWKDKYIDSYTYQFQNLLDQPVIKFPTITANPNNVMEKEKIIFGDLRLIFNILPRTFLNPYFGVGGGIMKYENSHADQWQVKFGGKPFTMKDANGVNQTKSSDLKDDANTKFMASGSFGFDIRFNEWLALNLDATYHMPFGDGSDMMDGFGDDVTRNMKQIDPGFTVDSESDSWMTVTAGVQVYLFGDSDKDNDGLSNSEEEELGTDPLNPDTDGDGLLDGEEVQRWNTDPTKRDTDGDGLMDNEEIAEKTDPRNPDTDGDGLNDGDEKSRGTKPLVADTDNDGLVDGQEVLQFKTDPLVMDTDKDGLNDGDEVTKYKTDPSRADSDGDGLNDSDEIARGTNPMKADSDGDGLSDSEEVKTANTNPLNRDTDGDSLSDGDEVKKYGTDPLKIDTDGDTLNDDVELNRTKTSPIKPDTDGDTVKDAADKCPTVFGSVNNNGCPEEKKPEPPPPPMKVGMKMVLENVEFETGKADLVPASLPNLDKAVESLTEYPNMVVEISGHTDNKGKAKLNKELSLRRAESVKQYLVSRGINPMRIQTKGYGSSQPRDNNKTESGRARNRRIEFKILRFE